MTATVYALDGRQARVTIREKVQAHERALDLIAGGQLQHSDLAVLVALTRATDNGSGEALRRIKTLGGYAGLSESSVKRSLHRLEAAGLIARQHRGPMVPARQAGRPAQRRHFCNSYELRGGAAAAPERRRMAAPERMRSPVNPPPGFTSEPTKKSLPPLQQGISDGRSAAQRSQPAAAARGQIAFTQEDVDWLATAGRYFESGFGAESCARDDLERLARAGGPAAVRRWIAQEKAGGFFGQVLCNDLERRIEWHEARNGRRSA